jgi:choline-sulfatase
MESENGRGAGSSPVIGRREFLASSFGAGLLNAQPSSRKLNLLYILTDQHSGLAGGFAGDGIAKTPHLDRLASEGVTFTHAFSAGMTCGPSRASLLTGLHHQSHGVRPGAATPPELPNLSDILRSNGYAISTDADDHLSWLKSLGYRNVESSFMGSTDFAKPLPLPIWRPAGRAGLAPEHSHDSYIAQNALRFLEENRNRPFACFVQFRGPHDPYLTPRPFDTMFRPDDILMPAYASDEFANKPPRQLAAYLKQGMNKLSDSQIRQLIALYYGMLAHDDMLAGQVLQRLDDLGLRDNTLVVYLADHGDTMGRHRLMSKDFAFYEPSVRVPMIFRGPGLPAGRRIGDLVSGIDHLPTLLELLNLPAVPKIHGRSLAPYWTKGFRDPDRAVFCGQGYEGTDRAVMMRTANWKLTRFDDGGWELYDLAKDPGELRNVYSDPAYSATLGALKDRLLTWDRQTPHRAPLFKPGESPERIEKINAAFRQWAASQ